MWVSRRVQEVLSKIIKVSDNTNELIRDLGRFLRQLIKGSMIRTILSETMSHL